MTKKAYNAENLADIKAAEAAEVDGLDAIMKTPAGRRWLYNLIHTTCHVDLPSHVPGDPHTSAYNEGARGVGEALKLEAKTSPNYLRMLEENL